MDETEQKNNNDKIILKEELDININDLFTIDFKNLFSYMQFPNCTDYETVRKQILNGMSLTM